MRNNIPVADRCRGRWYGILTALGVDARILNRKNQPCPMCIGRDRFRWTNHQDNGNYICTHCGAGDGIKLVQELFSLDFKGAAEKIEGIVGKIQPDRARQGSADAQRSAMKAVWLAGHAIDHSDPVGLYLANRGILLPAFPKCLRYVPALRHEAGAAPAMIAQILSPEGTAANIHRTWLTKDGRKADLDPCRKIMAGSIPEGSAIRLAPAGRVLGIAEGIETALAASLRFGVPVWATINEGGMRRFRPPEGVEHLMIFGDNDINAVGQAAAWSAACDIGKAAQRAKRTIQTTVHIPDEPGTDWADFPITKERTAA